MSIILMNSILLFYISNDFRFPQKNSLRRNLKNKYIRILYLSYFEAIDMENWCKKQQIGVKH